MEPPPQVEPDVVADRVGAFCELAGLAAAVVAAFTMPTPWRIPAGLFALAAALFVLGFFGLAKR